jgi:hypothetical protein
MAAAFGSETWLLAIFERFPVSYSYAASGRTIISSVARTSAGATTRRAAGRQADLTTSICDHVRDAGDYLHRMILNSRGLQLEDRQFQRGQCQTCLPDSREIP